MLILTRKPGESILIQLAQGVAGETPVGVLFAGGPIEIVVAQVKGRQVKLRIAAHRGFNILRNELCLDSRD